MITNVFVFTEHDSYRDFPWIVKLVDFTTEILKQDRVKLVGICFGHQIIGRALGVKVGPNEKGWEVAVTNFDLSEEGKKLFGLEKMVCDLPFKEMSAAFGRLLTRIFSSFFSATPILASGHCSRSPTIALSS